MPSSKERERKLARAKIDRQQTRRAQQIRAQRQVQARIGAALAILVVLAGIGWATNWYGLNSPKSVADAECTWTPSSSSTDLKNVGTPPTTGIPMSGTAPLTITTSQGVIHGSLDVTQAPCTVASFNYLASKGFFTNTKCHRLTTDGLYVLQCGDPSGTGQGGPTYTIPDENIPIAGPAPADASASAPSSVVYAAGTIAVAKTSSPNSGSSQFFLVYKDSTLPDSYSVMGTMDAASIAVVSKVAAGGVAAGGASATDGPPKLTTTIQSFVVGKPVAASPSPAAPSPSASVTPSLSTSPAPPAPSTTTS